MRFAILDQKENALNARQVPNDFCKRPRNDDKFAWPVGGLVRPAEPRSFVRFPFGGHAETECARSGGCGGDGHRLVPKSVCLSNMEDSERTEKGRKENTLFFAEPAIENRLVGINAPIAQERPIAAGVFAFGRIAFNDENLLVAVGGFRNDLTERIGDKGITPKLQSGIPILWMAFKADAIYHSGVHAVGNGVAALNRFPSFQLPRTELDFLVRVPTDAGGIKNHLRTAKRGEP